jgi:hypothetical protein
MTTAKVAKAKKPLKLTHTDEELRKLAKDLVGNLVFMSDQCGSAEEASHCFLILTLMPKEYLDEMVAGDVQHFYEYNDKKMPMGVNGKPMFLSGRPITRSDYAKLRIYEGQIRSAIDEVTGCQVKTPATGSKSSVQKKPSRKSKPQRRSRQKQTKESKPTKKGSGL